MNYSHPDLRRALSAEYALGTLTPGARRRFEKLLQDDRELRRAVGQWENVLATLTLPLALQRPPERVWNAIHARIQSQRTQSARRPLWHWFAGGLAGLSLVAVLFITMQTSEAPILQAALHGESVDTAMTIRWHGDALDVQPLATAPIGVDRSLELWIVTAKGKAISLGVIPTQGKLRIALSAEQKREFGAHILLAVTLEPHGGSPTGVATGPIVYKGYLELART
ncbi:anti-sigma factor [Herbaspirillum sp. RTI4]|uniref:anti-sigma factor n=1 Tax=Herbaspirillum sp. RTI4 TaxID=3048640 RepID=UPI002AB51741|nr:anti-sigma factor [Herbaspirillum sp. RTI4]MDY7580014.1 anti-sigma factor [Herbaspirillum sp. RTI4]MEA9982828.1 anti-sigma factor [Herbaspirillum sp. RTI4]